MQVDEAVIASSSLLSYYDPYEMQLGLENQEVLVDGSIIAQNPSFYSLIYAKELNKKKFVRVVSIGSGYSNFGLLQALSPAYIKLDQSFLSQQRGSETRAALIRSAVEISHVIGAKVVVEGVEDDEHRALARDAGAEYVQGYAIAQPMPLADLTTWLADHPPPKLDPGSQEP